MFYFCSPYDNLSADESFLHHKSFLKSAKKCPPKKNTATCKITKNWKVKFWNFGEKAIFWQRLHSICGCVFVGVYLYFTVQHSVYPGPWISAHRVYGYKIAYICTLSYITMSLILSLLNVEIYNNIKRR